MYACCTPPHHFNDQSISICILVNTMTVLIYKVTEGNLTLSTRPVRVGEWKAIGHRPWNSIPFHYFNSYETVDGWIFACLRTSHNTFPGRVRSRFRNIPWSLISALEIFSNGGTWYRVYRLLSQTLTLNKRKVAIRAKKWLQWTVWWWPVRWPIIINFKFQCDSIYIFSKKIEYCSFKKR